MIENVDDTVDSVHEGFISEIQVSNVSFTYPNKPTPAIADITLAIPAGASVAFVGPSGAGMFNSVFCGADTCIVDIESQTNWLNAHVNLFSSLDVEFGVHWAKADLGVNSVQKPYLIDVDALCSLIESRQVPS
jgi:hypothetical protein